VPIAAAIPVSEQLKKVPAAVRPAIRAARAAVKTAAPTAREISYRSEPPRSKSAMWKIARYAVDDANVVGIGTFSDHGTLFFYRGRELDDPAGLLQGGGKEMRFITLREAGDSQGPAVKRLLRQAFELGRPAASG
jgi:hypothetical protein